MEDNKVEEVLKELKETPTDLLTPVDTGYKAEKIDSDITKAITFGKENTTGEKDSIILPDGQIQSEDADETESEGSAQADNDTVTNLGELLPPDTCIDLLQLVIVFIGVFFVSKKFGVEIDDEEFKFTTEEKQTIKKPLARCLKETGTFTKNPWVALIFVLISILLLKGMTIYQQVKEKKEEIAENGGEQFDKIIIDKPVKERSTGKRGRKKGGHNKPKTVTIPL